MEIFRTRRQYPAAPPEIEKDDKKRHLWCLFLIQRLIGCGCGKE
jgi:hypothetical protein